MLERLDDDMRKTGRSECLRDRSLGLDTSAMEAKLVSAGSERENLSPKVAGGDPVTWHRGDADHAGGGPVASATMARLVFLGTPEAAVPPLLALVGAGHDIALRRHPAGQSDGAGAAPWWPAPSRPPPPDWGWR